MQKIHRHRRVALAIAAFLLVSASPALAEGECQSIGPDKNGTIVAMAHPPSGGDDTAALEACINAAPPGATMRFPVPKSGGLVYTTNGIVDIYARASLTIEGAGVTFKTNLLGVMVFEPPVMKDRPKIHVQITNSTGITIKGLTIDGGLQEVAGDCNYSESWGNESGYQVENSSGVLLDGITVREVGGDFIYFGGGGGSATTNSRVTNWLGDCAGRMAAGFAGAGLVENITVENGATTAGDRRVGRSWLDLEGIDNTFVARNIVVRNNTVGHYSSSNFFIAAGGGGSHYNITVSGNTLVDNTLRSRIGANAAFDRQGYVIENNHGAGEQSGTLITCTNCDGLRVAGNTQTFVNDNPDQPACDKCVPQTFVYEVGVALSGGSTGFTIEQTMDDFPNVDFVYTEAP
jgi:hypothetical protein